MEYRVGIDLGGTNVAVGVVNGNMEIVARATVKTRPQRMLDDVICDIACCVKEAVKKAGITLQDCISVGIGAPGYCLARQGMVVYANNLGWKNVPLCEELQQELGVPVRLSNDANCAALGEVIAGAAKGAKSAVMITLGTGVGGGVVLNGKVYEGDVGPGTEMGHTTLILGGEPCTCGQRGCLEAYASATGLLRQRHRPLCPAFQPPPGGGKGTVCAAGAGAAAGVFCLPPQPPCRSSQVETPGVSGREYEEIVKKWKQRKKVRRFHFLFSANCAILFNGILSKSITLPACTPQDRT